MNEHRSFGGQLSRLLEYRNQGISDLSSLAGIPDNELRAMFDGDDPDPALLRRLAPAVQFHTADLFVLAGVPVPDDLAPLDKAAGALVPWLVRAATGLSPEGRMRVLDLVQLLPRSPRLHPVPQPKSYEQYPPGFGGTLVRLLANRNLAWESVVRILRLVTEDRVYLSAATIGLVGRGKAAITPDLLSGIVAILGIPADDLAILGGVNLQTGEPVAQSVATYVAALVWEARSLTAEQLRQAQGLADSMNV